jgi:hypothetical protein
MPRLALSRISRTWLSCWPIFIALAFVTPAHALENENLLVTMPQGYKVGFHKKADASMISEMVPNAETVESWTEMVTVQIFYNMRDVTLAQYRARIEKLWADACPGSSFAKVKEGIENLYPNVTWSQKCPLNKQTGKPELTWLKGIQGKDSFYLVQKAYKFEPSAEQLTKWIGFLDAVRVCDTRSPLQPCKLDK